MLFKLKTFWATKGNLILVPAFAYLYVAADTQFFYRMRKMFIGSGLYHGKKNNLNIKYQTPAV